MAGQRSGQRRAGVERGSTDPLGVTEVGRLSVGSSVGHAPHHHPVPPQRGAADRPPQTAHRRSQVAGSVYIHTSPPAGPSPSCARLSPARLVHHNGRSTETRGEVGAQSRPRLLAAPEPPQRRPRLLQVGRRDTFSVRSTFDQRSAFGQSRIAGAVWLDCLGRIPSPSNWGSFIH